LKTAGLPFESFGTVSYSHFIASMAVSLAVLSQHVASRGKNEGNLVWPTWKYCTNSNVAFSSF